MVSGVALGQQRAVDQHRHAVGKAEHQVHVVLDQQHRHVGGQRGHGLQQFFALAGGHARHGLVEQQHARLAGQRNRDLQQAALAIGQVLRLLLRHIAQAELLEQLPRPLGNRLRWRPAAATIARRCPACCDTTSASVSSGVIESKSWLIWKVRTSPRATRLVRRERA